MTEREVILGSDVLFSLFQWPAQALCSYVLWDSKAGFVLSLFLNFLPKSRLLFLQKRSYMKKSVYYLSTLLSKLYDTKIAKPGKHEIVFIPGKTSNTVKSE